MDITTEEMGKIKRCYDDINERWIYSSERDIIAVSYQEEYQEYLSLGLAKLIKDNIDIFWSKEYFNLVNNLKRDIEKISKIKEDLELIKKVDGENSFTYRKIAELKETDTLNIKIINEIQNFLIKNKLHKLKDISINDSLSDNYIRFFNKDVSFEILVFYLFQKLKFSEQVTLYNYMVAGKSGFWHPIDVTVITPLHITITEVKSGKAVKRTEIMKLIGQKSDINADIAFLVATGKFSERKEYEDKYRNLFVLDNALNKDFKTTLNWILEKY